MTERALYASLIVFTTSILSCADTGSVDPKELANGPAGLFVSDPSTESSSSSSSMMALGALAEDDVAYISVAPRTLLTAERAQILNRSQQSPPTIVAVIEGGFDPVAVAAADGDSIEIIPFEGGQTFTPLFVKVPRRRPPAIVRARPPKGRTDVALNVIVTIIFTEPVNPQTVNATTVRVFRGTTAIDGEVVLKSNGWEAEFHPVTALDPLTTYTVSIGREVRDADGDALEGEFASSFVTGTRPCDESQGSPCDDAETVSVSGTVLAVSASGRMPVPNGFVTAWGRRADGTEMQASMSTSDAQGRFSFSVPPRSAVYFRAAAPGFDQPCGSAIDLAQNGSRAEVELFSARPPTFNASPRSPALWGTVAERVPDPEGFFESIAIPLAGVRVNFESPRGIIALTTTTNVDGWFSFCSIPPASVQVLIIAKAGYVPQEKVVSVGPVARVLTGIELTRSPPP